MTIKKVEMIKTTNASHMVGNGLPVRTFFSYSDLGKSKLSPFLLLDYCAPVDFPPTDEALGVDMHPHRGFETVTLVFQGGLSHRDSAGNEGNIGPGDVQWMTAGSGVLHEELHSAEFRKTGGTLQMVQLWVNLPARMKMTEPAYQTILNKDIPVVTSADNTVSVRIVAGEYSGKKGPARTFTAVNLWDVQLAAGAKTLLTVPDSFTAAIFVLEGTATINGASTSGSADLVILEREGSDIIVESSVGVHLLLLNGQPIEEPVVGYGPFVMNTHDQIMEALNDYRSGNFGG